MTYFIILKIVVLVTVIIFSVVRIPVERLSNFEDILMGLLEAVYIFMKDVSISGLLFIFVPWSYITNVRVFQSAIRSFR